MTTPGGGASAGRLHATVEGDTSGFARDLQRKINAETRAIRAKIKTEIDSTGLAAQARRAATVAARDARLRIKTEVDTARLTSQVQTAAAAASRGVVVKIGVKVAASDVAAAVRAARDAAEGRVAAIKVKIKADLDTDFIRAQIAALQAGLPVLRFDAVIDTDRVRAAVEAARREATRKKWEIDLSLNLPKGGIKGLPSLGAVVGLLKLPVVAAGIGLLVSLAAQAAAGLFAMGAAAANAANLIALIPAAATGLGLIIGTIAGALKGVGAASKAMNAASQNGAKQGAALAAAREAANKRVADATRAVGDAIRRADETAIDGARAVGDARRRVDETSIAGARAVADARKRVDEASVQGARQVETARVRLADTTIAAGRRAESAQRAYAAAERDGLRATQDLTRAREESREALEDLQFTLRGAALSEEGASIAVERARQRLDEANRSATSTNLDRREADLGYRQAILRLDEVRESNVDLATEARKTTEAGVEGSEAVLNAQERIVEANRRAIEAEQTLTETRIEGRRDIADAERDLAEAQVETRERSADAERGLQDAIKDTAQANADAQRGLQDTIQSTARANADAQRSVTDAQDGVTEAIKAQSAALATETKGVSAVARALAELSPAGQRFATFLNDVMRPALKGVKFAAQEAFLPPLQTALTTLLALQGPLESALTRTGQALGFLAIEGSKTLASGPFTDRFAQVAESNAVAIEKMTPGVQALLMSFIRLAAAGGPTIERIADALSRAAIRLDALIARAEDSGALGAMFTRAYDAAAQLGRILADVTAGLFNIGKAGSESGRSLLTSLEDATQRFREFTGEDASQARFTAFFDRSAITIRELGWLLKDLTTTIFRIGENVEVSESLNKIRTELLPQIERIVTALGATLGPAVIDLFTSLATVLANISEAGGGGLEAFVERLNLFAGVLVRLSELPGGSEALSTILTFAGGAAANAFAVGLLVKVFGPLFGLVGKVVGAIRTLVFLWPALQILLIQAFHRVQALAAALGRAVLAAGRFAVSLVTSVASALGSFVAAIGRATLATGQFLLAMARTAILRAFAVAMAAVNLVMSLNPFVLIALAIGAFIAALILAYRNSDRFREIVDRAFAVIRTIITEVLLYLRGYVVEWFRTVVSIFRNTFGLIETIVRTVFAVISTIFRTTVDVWRTIFSTVFDVIRIIFQTGFNVVRGIITTVLALFRGDFDGAARAFTGIFRSLWDGIQRITDTVFGGIRRVLDIALSGMRTAFDTTVNGIRSAWDRLREIAAAPIRFMVNTVLNDGLIRGFNAITSRIGGPRIDPIRLQFAKGGLVPGGYKPGKDTQIAAVSPGEGILVPEAVRGMAKSMGVSAGNAIQWLNSAYSRRVGAPGGRLKTPPGAGAYATGGVVPKGNGIPGFHLGGVVGDVENWSRRGLAVVSRGAEAGRAAVGAGINQSQEWLAQGARFIVDQAMRPVRALINRIPGGEGLVTQVAKSAVGKGIESALEFGAKRDRESPPIAQTGNRPEGGLPAGMNTPPGSGWGPIVQALRNAGTPHRITSTNTGKHATNSLHYKNRAVDLGGPRPGDGPGMRRIFETIRGAFGGKITELFYTPMGYCVPMDTVILTRRGWLTHQEVVVGDETIGFNPETGRSEWTKITDVVHFADQPVVEMARRGFAVRSTPGHRWVAEQRQRVAGKRAWTPQWVTTDEVNDDTRLILARPARTAHTANVTPAEASLTAWLLGDGHVSVSWPEHEVIAATIYQSSAKPVTLGRLRALLEGVPHTETMRTRREAHHGDLYAFRLDTKYARDLLHRTRIDKEGVEAFVLSLGDEARAAFLQSAHDAEGSVMNRGKPGEMLTFSQNAGQFLDAVRLAAYLEGHRPTLNATPKPEGRQKQHYIVAFARPSVTGQAIVKRELERQDVWCVTTELGSWTMRQDEQILLTGNSIKNGRVVPPIAAAGHNDHVHAGLADGGQVNPRPGGTLLRLAEAGLPETVVDTGKMNSLIDGILSGKVRGGDGVRIEEGAIHVTIVRPPDEPSARSLNSGLRSLASFGLFGSS